ncbi:PPC domain-containing protein [bacterium]|nr:PPC domain-containing protein [bacterium]
MSLIAIPAFAQERPAHIGYIYPAGGRQGTTVEVIVGGQALGGQAALARARGPLRPGMPANNIDVLVSGEGLHVRIAKIYPPARPLQGDQRAELVEKLWNLRQKRFSELPNGEEIEQQMMESGRRGGLIPPRILQEMNKRQQQQKGKPAQGQAALRNPNAGQTNPNQTRQAGRGGSLAARGQQREDVIARLKARRLQESSGNTPSATPATRAMEPIPEHPLLDNLESKSLRQLQEVVDELILAPRRQPNPQIAEMIKIEITIDADAAPGERQIRLSTPTGLTNPLKFYVGTWPEVREQEPNDPGQYAMLPPEPAVSVSFVLNGQIKPGDVDRFKFFAQKGQNLVVQARARELMPYLADAVPGWFQATLALYDSNGREVGYADDYRFNPDPVLLYKIPTDGEYELEVRDSIYRGREDFVYRINVGEQPFITSLYPLGGRQGSDTIAAVGGWNLSDNKVRLDTRQAGLYQAVLKSKLGRSNQVAYDVGVAPESAEKESNDAQDRAQGVALPVVVNGGIGKAGDVDYYRFSGRADEQVVAEVFGRRLESPIDSLLRLLDADGNVIAWNDDRPDKSQGLKTHYADSYILAKLPRDGMYYVQVSDAQRHGGDAYHYRLRIEPPRPDFEVRMTPSSLNFTGGRPALVTAYALRRDGFDGDISVSVKEPSAFSISGGRIPHGRESVRMTMFAPPGTLPSPVTLQLEARANIGGRTVTHAVVPAEDMEQAFAYHHLVQSSDLVAKSRGGGRLGFTVEPSGSSPVVIRSGGTAQFRITASPWLAKQGYEIEINQPPAGIKIQEMHRIGAGQTMVVVKADAKPGLADNLIFEAFTEIVPRQQTQRPGAKPTPAATAAPNATATPAAPPVAQKRRVSAGVLPAIPIEVK